MSKIVSKILPIIFGKGFFFYYICFFAFFAGESGVGPPERSARRSASLSTRPGTGAGTGGK